MNQIARALAFPVIGIFSALSVAQSAVKQPRLLPPANCPAVSLASRPWLDQKYTPQCRAQFIVMNLKTLDEKLAFLAGSNGRSAPGQRNMLQEYGLKRGGNSDGPAGVRTVNGSTALPTPLTVGASFDPELAKYFGDLLGQEMVAAGISVALGPAMDYPRTWHFGRVTESFGEDPYLTSTLIVPEIRALQTHHVVATMKHFAAYTQEQGRAGDFVPGTWPGVNESISERALREIYLPAFHAATVKGQAGAVMCSFPRVNGTYACENSHLYDILKDEWGFDGYVSPDSPGASRSLVPSLLAGMDGGALASSPALKTSLPPLDPTAPLPTLTSLHTTYVGQQSLRDAVKDGEFSMEHVNDLILRRLTPLFRVGVFDHPPTRLDADGLSTPERRAMAAHVITEGSVLLKNDNGLLPISSTETIALIGPNATDKAIVTEQGSPHVLVMHLASVLDSVRTRAGRDRVVYAPGTLGLVRLPDIPTAMLKTPKGESGVQVEYFDNPKRDFSGQPSHVDTVPTLHLVRPPNYPGMMSSLRWSARLTTLFTPATTGVQHFSMQGTSNAALFVDGKKVGEYMRGDLENDVWANVPMIAGKPVEIRVEYSPRTAFINQETPHDNGSFIGAFVAVGWSGPNNLIREAAEAAAKADVAIVFVSQQVGEGMDRLDLNIQSDQNDLIEAVAKANPHTVVVLNTGGAVKMPWLSHVPAVLETWLPGDADGPGTAKLLFGDVNPSGHLPITFPADETQGPATGQSQYPGTLAEDGSLDTAHFDEGIFVGYRFWDAHNQKPLFPFGYGLSYTRFSIKGIGVHASTDGGATVDLSVRNTGKVAGSQVAQVYLGFPPSVGEPPKQLKGFAKVMLNPGEEKTVHVTIEPDAFQYWNDQRKGWTIPHGPFQVMVGSSSRDILWTGSVTPATTNLPNNED